jgi:flavodoxin
MPGSNHTSQTDYGQKENVLMKAMVVYDSVHGNTQKVAEAVAQALGAPEEVEVQRVTEVEPSQLAGLDILVVGAPTHAFQPTPAAKKFLRSIPAGALKGVEVAAFDTRISEEDADSGIFSFFVRFFGYAAKPIADGLKRKGGRLALPPEGFFVKGTEGPLKPGELERASEWARSMMVER